MHVVVVGGGIAGLCAADSLRRRGATVTVLEKSSVGAGASSANAGWLCPTQAGPLPAPGLRSSGMKSLLTPDSPLYIAPAQVPRMLLWLLRFAARCNPRDYRHGVQAVAQLSRRTFELAERFADDGIEFDLHRRGLVVATQHPEEAKNFLAALSPVREAGVGLPRDVLDGPALRQLEPVLSERIQAGVLITDHWHVDAPNFIPALAAHLRSTGVELHQDAEVVSLTATDGVVREVRTAAGETYAPDAVILATGAWAGSTRPKLGVRVPVAAGKGYSFQVRLDTPPQHAILLLDPHIGCSPLTGDRVRIAGTMEFSGLHSGIHEKRLGSIVRGAELLLQGFDGSRPENVRGGLRPIAPDGLPIIDRAPRHRNLYLATAYSMLGMTLAAAAGEALAGFVLTGDRPAELAAFRATRF